MAGDFGISDRSDINVTNWSKSGYNYSTRALPRFGAQIAFGWQGIFKEQDMDQDGIDNKKISVQKSLKTRMALKTMMDARTRIMTKTASLRKR
jgi:hypothetical protein